MEADLETHAAPAWPARGGGWNVGETLTLPEPEAARLVERGAAEGVV